MAEPTPCYASDPPPAGLSASLSLFVEPASTARNVGSGSLDVLATPALAALMEAAACKAVNGFLAPGWTSVGAELVLKHEAATPLGGKVEATAAVTAVDGRRIDFELTASDEAGRVGSGTHSRFVVQSDKFMDRAAKRLQG